MGVHYPAHPGEILKELVIMPLELAITDASEHLDVSGKTLSKDLNGRGAIAQLHQIWRYVLSWLLKNH